ncbi:MAG: hypothetical protein CMQ35_07975 [Gammaproteobacteria bacterium]|nr:hypothetical protein [Gammaproteobacteria bacterium]
MAGKRWIPDFLEEGMLSFFDVVAEVFRLQAEGKITEAEGQQAIAEAVKDDSGIWEWLKNAWDYELIEQDPDKKSKSLFPDVMSPSAIALDEDEEEEEEEGLTPLEVEELTESYEEQGVDPQDIPRDAEGNIVPLAERMGEQRTSLERIPDPAGSGRSLVPDTYIQAQIDPENWAAWTPVEFGQPEGALDRGQYDLAPVTGQMGIQDLEVFEARPESPMMRSVMGEDYMSLRWTDDPEAGMSFTPALIEDVPFTYTNAYEVYLAQTPENQKRIAEGLALGTGNTSFMYSAIGDTMFTNPDAIYADENVRRALIQQQSYAQSMAGITEGGFTGLGDEYIPEVWNPEEVQNISDELFQLAKNAGAVVSIGSSYGNAVASKVMATLTGKSGDDPRFRNLVTKWTDEIQRETMGRKNVSQTELQTMFGERIEGEFADEVATSNNLSRANTLAKVMGITV